MSEDFSQMALLFASVILRMRSEPLVSAPARLPQVVCKDSQVSPYLAETRLIGSYVGNKASKGGEKHFMTSRITIQHNPGR